MAKKNIKKWEYKKFAKLASALTQKCEKYIIKCEFGKNDKKLPSQV